MSKLSVTMVALALAACTALGVVSCQKEKTNVERTTPIRFQEKYAVERIVKFKKQIENHNNNPSAKSTETIGFEDALWNIENVFNATYSQPEVICSAKAKFEFTLYLVVDSYGNVLMNDLLNLYDDAVVLARQNYANDGFNNKVFRFMTIEADEPEGGVARLSFKCKTGERGDVPQNPYSDTTLYKGPFHLNDNYHYDYGKCDGTGINGADEELTYHVGQYITSQLTTPPDGTRTIYINSSELTIHGYEYPNDLFYRTNVSATCIDFNNMNRLYNTEKTLITETLPNDLQSTVYGMTPIEIEISADNSPVFIDHDNTIIYAWRVFANMNDVGALKNLLTE